jgi:predicted DNA-binding ribbon-helix-helix protein
MHPVAVHRKGERELGMKSSVVKRSISLAGHKTSVSLEEAFWMGLKEIADRGDISVSDLVTAIDSDRQEGNLSSAIRLFVLDCYRDQHSTQMKRERTREILAKVLRETSGDGC